MSRVIFDECELAVLYDTCPWIPCYTCMCEGLCRKVYPGQIPANTKSKEEFIDDMLGGQLNE